MAGYQSHEHTSSEKMNLSEISSVGEWIFIGSERKENFIFFPGVAVHPTSSKLEARICGKLDVHRDLAHVGKKHRENMGVSFYCEDLWQERGMRQRSRVEKHDSVLLTPIR